MRSTSLPLVALPSVLQIYRLIGLVVTDPLADTVGCTRDLPLLQKLGINTIRAYSVDSSLNHDSCMSAFSAAGIYTMYAIGLFATVQN
jgi:hypothetical protein